MSKLTIGQLARQANVNLETIRYYERRGLIPQPPRNASGYRQYGEQDLARTRFIKRAQALGFTLKEIAELLSLRVAPGTTCGQVKERVQVKIADVEKKSKISNRCAPPLCGCPDAARAGGLPANVRSWMN